MAESLPFVKAVLVLGARDYPSLGDYDVYQDLLSACPLYARLPAGRVDEPVETVNRLDLRSRGSMYSAPNLVAT